MKNLGGIFKQAQKLQESMQQAQEAVKNIEVVGESGVGMVKVTMNGQHDVLKVDIDSSVLQEDKALLEDLLAGAVNDANRKLEKTVQSTVKDFTGGIDMPAGMKFPF